MKENRSWRRYARFWGADPDRDIADEIAFHMAEREAEALARGLSAAEARREAQRAFGDRGRIESELRRIGRRQLRRSRRSSWISALRTDLGYSLSSFRRAPGVPLVIVLTLALGIGATTAVYTLFDAVVLRPLPVHEPSELFALEPRMDAARTMPGVAYPMLRALRVADESWQIAGSLDEEVTLHADGYSDRRRANLVTGNYFEMLGVRPQLGRLLREADEGAEGASPFVVISDLLWRTGFGGDRDVLGSTLRVNGQPFEIVGVGPRGFRGTSLQFASDLWFPITMVREIGNGGMLSSPDILTTEHFAFISLLGRARATASLATLNTRYLQRQAEVRSGDEEPERLRLGAIPITEAAGGRNREDVLRFMNVLWLVVGLCLAIACVNVMNLLLLRGRARWRELALRAALGAPRHRIFGQVLVENATLAAAGGAAGVLLGGTARRLLQAYALPGGIALGELPVFVDARVLVFALGMVAVVILVSGVVPALLAMSPRLTEALLELRQGAARRAHRPDGLLVATQVALTLVLVVGAMLFMRSLRTALDVPLGFRTDGLAAVSFSARSQGYTDSTGTVLFTRVLDAARARVGDDVVLSTRVPPSSGMGLPIAPVEATGMTLKGGVSVTASTPGLFDILGIPLRSGRALGAADRKGTPLVAVVNETAARAMWPGQDARGKQFTLFRGFGEPFTVVGVVADARLDGLGAVEPHVFVSIDQHPGLFAMSRVHLLARGRGSAPATLAALRTAMRVVDPQMPVFDGRSVDEQIDNVLMTQRFGRSLLLLFAAIACAISAVGIYAVTSFDVLRRRHELGVRSALGATRAELRSAVLTRIGPAVAAGTAIGLTLAALFTAGLRRFMFGITTYEPMSYAAAALAFAIIAAAAVWLPLRRAALTDPLLLMREK